MKIKELFEAPQLIKNLNTQEVDTAISECLSGVNKSQEIEKLGEKVSLLHLKFPTYGYYFVFNDKESGKLKIEYFVKYHKVDFAKSISPSSAIRQVLVWRRKNTPYVAGIAKKVFWEILWPKYKCLASDSQQTDEGQRVWFAAVGEAFKRSLTVRIANTNDNTFVDVKNNDEFSNNVDKTWGSTSWFQRMIIIIFE